MIVQSHEYEQGVFTTFIPTVLVDRKPVSMRIVPSKDNSSDLNQAFITAAVAVLKAAKAKLNH
jgi:hypothetical protein